MAGDPKSRAIVFVKNLETSVDDGALQAAFTSAGAVTEARVLGHGRGWVQFVDEAGARAAVRDLHGTLLAGREVQVTPHHARRAVEREGGGSSSASSSGGGSRPHGRLGGGPGGAAAGAPAFCNVYVKGLAENVTEAALQAVFSPFGPITSAVVIRDSTGRPRGFGFVNFERETDAARAVAELDGHMPGSPDGIPWTVTRAQTKSERQQESAARLERERAAKAERQAASNLYVKNLEADIDDQRLKELFSEFGDVRSCRVLRDEDGNSRSVGFVQFTSIEEAQSAIQGMNGRQVGARKIYVQVAQRKADRDRKAAATASALNSYEVVGGVGGAAGTGGIGGDGGGSEVPEHIHPAAFIGMPYYSAMAQPFFFGGPQPHAGLFPPPHHFQLPGILPTHLPMPGMPTAALGPHGGFYVYPTAGPEGLPTAAVPFPQYPAPTAAGGVPGAAPAHAAAGNAAGAKSRGGAASPANGLHRGESTQGMHRVSSMGGRPHIPQQQQPQHGSAASTPTAPSTTASASVASSKPGSKVSSPQTAGSSSSCSASDLLALGLQSASAEERDTILGEALFPLIDGLTGDSGLTPKVTGMILELGDSDLLRLVDDQGALQRKVGEALKMLRKPFPTAAKQGASPTNGRQQQQQQQQLRTASNGGIASSGGSQATGGGGGGGPGGDQRAAGAGGRPDVSRIAQSMQGMKLAM